MKKFIVALDQSPRAHQVLQTAVEMAQQQQAHLLLLHAVHVPVEMPVDIYYRPMDEVTTVLQRKSQEELEQMLAVIPTQVPRTLRTEAGSPWQVICEVAEEEKADLIIMGAHGYRFYERMLGTTAARVVNHAHCSVLVIRSPETQKKE